MATTIDPHDLAAIEELAATGLWQQAGVVEVRRLQELLKQQQSLAWLMELPRQGQQAALPQELPLDTSTLTEIERELLGDILTLFDDNGLTKEQTLALLGQVAVLIELVKQRRPQEPTKSIA